MLLAYDGGDFRGWQKQRDGRTVQGVLEEALLEITGQPQPIIGAGRTDAGVHATGQVAHFDTSWTHSLVALRQAFNSLLPREVAILAIDLAPRGFHARHSATARSYRYTLLESPVRQPLRRRTTFHLRQTLDVERMQRAATALLGQHDFGGFGRPMTPGGPTQRRMEHVRVSRRGDEVHIELRANAFLRHQVRRTVGMLVDVGRAKREVEEVKAVLERSPSAPVPWRAPAQGLVLEAVHYPPDEEIECMRSLEGRNHEEQYQNLRA
jgi:tRNA pseudouridine38-40 synthase